MFFRVVAENGQEERVFLLSGSDFKMHVYQEVSLGCSVTFCVQINRHDSDRHAHTPCLAEQTLYIYEICKKLPCINFIFFDKSSDMLTGFFKIFFTDSKSRQV